jgi:undecaprenyl-diphosphatase
MSLDTEFLFLLNGLAGQSPVFDRIIIFFASDFAYVVLAAFVAFLYVSPYSNRKKLEILFIAAVSGVVARFGATELIRYFIHRARPFVDHTVEQLLPHTAWSFPSGHATFFFAMATAVYLYDKRWGTAFFGLAALMTVSRVVAGIHYPSDIIAGALIGALVGYGTFHIARILLPKQAN